MKLKIFAVLAIAIGVFAVLSGVAPTTRACDGGCTGPQDHSWGVSFTPATVTNGSHPNIVVTVGLGQTTAVGSGTPDTSFFSNATTRYNGITPAPAPVGDNLGNIAFDIQTNVNGATGNIDTTAGNVGQPVPCNKAGTLHITVAGAAAPILAGATSGTLIVPTASNPADNTGPSHGGYSFDEDPDAGQGTKIATTPAGNNAVSLDVQNAGGLASTSAGGGTLTIGGDTVSYTGIAVDTTGVTSLIGVTGDATSGSYVGGVTAVTFPAGKGGIPMGVTHLPDWYLPVLSALGVPTGNVVARSWAGATIVPTSHVTVTFLTINALNGNYVSVTLLGDPRGLFSLAGQTTVTCPPFGSTVTQNGVSIASTYSCPGTDYFTNPMAAPCSGSTVGPGGNNDITVSGTTGTTYPYKITLATASDTDNDGQFALADNCHADANPTQTSTAGNGIGDACNGTIGTSAVWQNSTAAAITNASFPCNGSDADHTAHTAPPWAKCQDADLDGALNQVDNCPLVPNGPLDSWLKDNNGTILDSQTSSSADGIGVACSPNPTVPGAGLGWNSSFAFDGYCTAGAPGCSGTVPFGTSASHFMLWSDVCNVPFTVGTGAGVPSCKTGLSATSTRLDSNKDGFADFYNPGDGTPCLYDYAADTNLDGYKDGMQAGPVGPVTGCSAGVNSTGTPGFIAGMAKDPLSETEGCFTNPTLATADINGSNSVNSTDLTLFAQSFGKTIGSVSGDVATDPRERADMNHDSAVNSSDLTLFAKAFGTASVSGACTAKTGAAHTTKNAFWAVAWDRMGAGTHTIAISCTGPGGTTVTASQVVAQPGGRVNYGSLLFALYNCTFTFDGNAVPNVTTFNNF